jgi:uncharacterized delta-60 repeat protein
MTRQSSRNRRVQGNGKPNGSEASHGAFAANDPKHRGCWRRSFLLHLRRFEPLCWFRRLWTAFESFVAGPKRMASVQRTSYRRRLKVEVLCDRALMAGDLDTTFDGDGKVTTDFGVNSGRAFSVAIQSDGKIVVAGGSNSDFALARYNSNGSLDTTFDGDGVVTTDFGNSDTAFSVAIQSDGKIVVAGFSFNGRNGDFALARYNSDGGVDYSFGSGGKVATDFSGDYDGAFSVAIQRDGKIVVAGGSDHNGSIRLHDFALARYDSNGILDPTFGSGGKVTTDFGGNDEGAKSVAIQSDGKIVVAGHSGNVGSNNYFALTRYESNGSLDTTFDGDGKVTTDFGSGFDRAYGVAIQSDGKIVVAGFSADSINEDFALARFNVSEAPTDITLSLTSIAENSPANTTVGTLSTIDPDSGDTFTYTLVAGTGDTDNGAFNISDSNLRATSSFDFETKSSYTIRIRSTDQLGQFTEKTFTITVIDINESPTNISLSSSTIAENAAANTPVGTISTADPDAGNSFTYTLVAGSGDADNAAFNIAGSILRATNTFNFETKSSYTVRVRTTDQGGLFTEKMFTITVTNVHEPPMDIALSSTSIPENVGANAVVGTLSTTDPDGGNTFAYSLVSGTGSTDNGAFNISGSTLRATSSLDFETKNSYTVRIRSTDQGGLFTEKKFAITVLDVNERPTDIGFSSSSIAENAGNNAVVGMLSTTDVDAGNTFTYTLVAGTGGEDNATFNISGNTLRATSSFDFEDKSSYSVRVRTTDQGGLFTERAFTIAVVDVNEAPTEIGLSNTNVVENADPDAVVGNLSTADVDAGDAFSYVFIPGIGDDDNSAFRISGSMLRAVSSLDFETRSNYTIRMRSTDQGGLFVEKTFTISVANINEAPTDIALSSSSIAENAGANVVVGTLTTTDVDAGDTFTYTLVAGTGDTDNGAFHISGSTLRATSSFDFETKPSYTVRIRSTDQGGLFTEKTFTISVTNVNEAPADIALSSTSIAENAGANAVVGTLTTNDVDAGDTFTYTLVTGAGDTDNGAFHISGSNLRATSNFDFETKSSYSVRIRSTDQNGFFVENAFAIQVVNANDTPTDIGLSWNMLAENAGVDTTVGTFSTTDVDAGNAFAYSLVAGAGDADNASFRVLGSALVTTSNFDFETKSSYSIRIRSTDQGGLFVEKTFVVAVIDVNEAPADVNLTSTTIPENAGSNAPVGSFSTADVDADNTFVYSLVAGSGDTDNAAFNVSGSTLRATSSFDFETRADYTIRVRSTDQGGLFVEKVFTIRVVNANDAPVAVGDSYWVSVSTPQMLDVLANDSDIDSAIDPTSIKIVQPPAHGTAMPMLDGTVRYIPDAGYRGVDGFTYRVRDSLGLFSNDATVQLRVNSAPNTTPDSLVVKQTVTTVLDVLRNDSDPDGTLDPATLVIVNGSDVADLAVQPNGTIRFTPREGFLGTTQFRYVVSDNEGRPSVPTDVTVLVVVSVYQNPRNRFDVDDDGTVSPLDILVLINLLNSQAPLPTVDGLPGPPPYVDVNADNRVDPLDVLNVINHINSRGNGEGEGGVDRTFDDVFASDDWLEELRKTNRLRLTRF